MSSTTHTHKDTLQFIADILSFKNSTESLKQKISSSTIDWDQFVTIASDYLVLTTCYCRLSQKKLLNHLPKDLESYLKEITNINRNRNQGLIDQVTNISFLFDSNAINYTLLKGTALLIGGYFNDLGERMVGDIDILVDKEHIEKAYQLLINKGYKSVEQTLRGRYFDNKHLPRLIPSNYIGAVEIHSKVLSKPYKAKLVTEEILNHKELTNNSFIPCAKDLLEHSVLNFQINDSGYFYNSMHLRSLYDTIVIMKAQKSSSSIFFNLPYAKSYISIGTLFFNDFQEIAFNTFRSQLFLKTTNNSFLKNLIGFVLKKTMLMKLICHRFFFFIKSKGYRMDVMKDYRRIFLLLKSKF